jgi:hypothetical protein
MCNYYVNIGSKIMDESGRMCKKEGYSLKHSGYGIASFVIYLSVTAVFLSLLVIESILEKITPGGTEANIMLIVISMGFFLLLSEPFFVVNLLGVGLAAAGLVQTGRRKLFSILGLVLNLLSLGVTAGVITITLLFSMSY